ncbi:MAG: hypothetical protein GY830_01650 [Bacteroidetes bacterium]|nr:hypothetical protein [Bacteroidota bacterium]
MTNLSVLNTKKIFSFILISNFVIMNFACMNSKINKMQNELKNRKTRIKGNKINRFVNEKEKNRPNKVYPDTSYLGDKEVGILVQNIILKPFLISKEDIDENYEEDKVIEKTGKIIYLNKYDNIYNPFHKKILPLIKKYFYDQCRLIAISEAGNINIYNGQNQFSLINEISSNKKIKSSVFNQLRNEVLFIDDKNKIFNCFIDSDIIKKNIEIIRNKPDDLILLTYSNLKENISNAKKVISNKKLGFQLSPNSYILATIDYHGTIRFWDIDKQEKKWSMRGYFYNPANLRDVRSNFFIIGNQNGNIDTYYNTEYKKIITGYKDIVIICITDHNNKNFAIAREKGIFEIWNRDEGMKLRHDAENMSPILNMSSPNNKEIIIHNYLGEALKFDTNDIGNNKNIIKNIKSVKPINFINNNQIICLDRFEKNIKLFDLKNKRLQMTFDLVNAEEDKLKQEKDIQITSIVKNQEYLICGDNLGNIYLFDCTDGSFVKKIDNLNSSIVNLYINPVSNYKIIKNNLKQGNSKTILNRIKRFIEDYSVPILLLLISIVIYVIMYRIDNNNCLKNRTKRKFKDTLEYIQNITSNLKFPD